MHIFHVITTLNKGGAESHLVDLCRALSQRGVRLSVAFLKGDAYWVPTLEAMGIETIKLGARHHADPAAVIRLAREIRRQAPDIVHAHMPPAELYATAALCLAGGPAYMVSKHVDRYPFYPGPGARLLEHLCARPAQSVLCISQAVNDYFQERWPASLAEKLVTVRYGMNPCQGGDGFAARAADLRREWGIAEDETVFGIAARFVEQKAIDTLITAFARLKKTTGQPIRLVLVGQGPLESSLRGLADELNLGDAIVWAGFRTDIPVVMRALDVFVLSSIFEGFGLVLLEAMEAATPIVASGVSAIPEIVVDGETGHLVPPRQPDRLRDAMRSMLDPEARKSLGAAGHRRLIERFSVDKMADATFAIYCSILASAPTTGGTAHDAVHPVSGKSL